MVVTSVIRPHGLQALFALRLEKGHVIVGMDTELDTTPRRLGMDWAVRMDKPRFIGRAALERTAGLPDHRRLVGFTMEAGSGDAAPVEGSPIWSEGEIIGHVTGSWHSPVLGRTVMLGWQKSTAVPRARRDRWPRGRRRADTRSTTRRAIVPALDRVRGFRVVADPAALEGARWTGAGKGATVTVLRLAPDDVFALDAAAVEVDDPDAIVEDETWVRRRMGSARCHSTASRVVAAGWTSGARAGVDRRCPGEAVAPRRR